MEYSNSRLVDCVVKSPNHSGRRNRSIDRITPHCVVGQLTAEGIGNCFPSGVEASCNYGIGKDGRVCLIVDEANRSWCTSSSANDQRAVTIECASDMTEPYTMTAAVYEKLIELCIDICIRNGKTKLLWLGEKNKTLNYKPKEGEMILTVHRWFANKSCPGDWLYGRLGETARRVTQELLKTSGENTGRSFYKIQCGAYKKKENAQKELEKIREKGFEAFIIETNGWYKIQMGAYEVRANAEKQQEKIRNAGFEALLITVDYL